MASPPCPARQRLSELNTCEVTLPPPELEGAAGGAWTLPIVPQLGSLGWQPLPLVALMGRVDPVEVAAEPGNWSQFNCRPVGEAWTLSAMVQVSVGRATTRLPSSEPGCCDGVVSS